MTADLDREIVAMFQQHHAALVRLAYLMTSDADLAEDLTQEAYARFMQRGRRMRQTEATYFYLRSTVMNLARDSLRRRLVEMRERVRSARERAQVGSLGDLEGSVDLMRALSRLPSRKRACVVLRYYADLTEADTARTLGISVGTVKSQTAKALDQLEHALRSDARMSAETEVVNRDGPAGA